MVFVISGGVECWRVSVDYPSSSQGIETFSVEKIEERSRVSVTRKGEANLFLFVFHWCQLDYWYVDLKLTADPHDDPFPKIQQ